MKTKLMLLIFTLSFMVMAACAKEPGGKDNGLPPDWLGGIEQPNLDAGKGDSETNPIEISTADQLAWLAHSVNGTLVEVPAEDGGESTWSSDDKRSLADRQNGVLASPKANNYTGKFIKLTDHVALGGTPWPMIGRLFDSANPNKVGGATLTDGTPFSGTFDGQGYRIMSITVAKGKDDVGVGLFGYVRANGENVIVKNLTLWSGTVTGGGEIGGVVGKGIGTETGRVKLEYLSTGPTLTVTGGSYTGDDDENAPPTGGIAGSILNGDMSYCYNEGKVNGQKWVAGVVACLHNGVLEHSFNKGAVTAVNKGDPNHDGSIVGGVTAHSLTAGGPDIGAKTFNVFNAGTVEGTRMVGGVLAWHALGGINDSINSGLVIADKNVESKGQIVGTTVGPVTVGTGNYYIKTTDGTTDAGNKIVGNGPIDQPLGNDINSADNRNKNLADMLNDAAKAGNPTLADIWKADGSDIIFVTDKSRDKPL